MAAMSQGGMVHKYADGGPVSALGQFYAGNNSANGNGAMYVASPNAPLAIAQFQPQPQQAPEGLNDKQINAGASALGSANIAPSGAADRYTSEPNSPIEEEKGGGGGAMKIAKLAMAASQGAVVPGKAKVKGDSLKNDTVPAVLSPGEIVIPRSIAQGKDAPKRAAEFVAKVLAKNGLKK